MSMNNTVSNPASVQAPSGAIDTVRQFLTGLQDRITSAITGIDGTPFLVDRWTKPAGEKLQGNGITQILEGGPVFERAGCGFSHVTGPQLPPSATQHRPELAGAPFEAMGVSLVFHPRNPYVPTVHMNVRMLAATPAGGAPVCWFGGGMDLTPYYGFEEDARHFHRTCQAALAPFGDDKYPRFKQWCDEYFFLKHRNEPRGVGGVFWDDFEEGGFDGGFAFADLKIDYLQFIIHNIHSIVQPAAVFPEMPVIGNLPAQIYMVSELSIEALT